jgi:iron complex transport system substrate-binding protein
MGNWTSEQPMLILWAAQKFYPDRFKDIDMVKELGDFYKKFYNSSLSTEQLKEILSGNMV